MPLKKLKLSEGQQRLGMNFFTSQESIESNSDTDRPCSESSSFVKLDAGSFGESESSSSRRGTTTSWRSFGESKWRDIYPWLLLKEDGLYCQYCIHNKHEVRSRSGVFITMPYTGNRPDKLGKHESCKAHADSQMVYQEWKTRVANKSTVVSMVERSNTLTVDEFAFCDAMRCMYYLNKHEIAHTTNFSGLRELCVLLGNRSLSVLKKSGNTNYESEQIMGEIVEVIGITLEEEILSEVNKSPFYSIILDEATDISVTKQLGISIQYLDNNAVVRTRNLKLLEIIHGTADVITEAVISYLTSKAPVTLDISKLSGGATDGASVMVGCEHGVVTIIKQVVPTFIATHCSAHRLSLATCDASNASTMIQRFQRILNQIYVFFSRSTVRTSELCEMQKALSEPHLKLQRPTETRWLSHQSAVDALRRSIKAVYATLQHEAPEGEATAHGLCNEIVNPTFIASLLLLSNILAILGNLSRTFQLAQLNLLAVEQLVEDAKAALCVIKEDPLHGGYMMDLEATMKEIEVTTPLEETSFIKNAKSYSDAIITNLENRFPQVRTLTLLGYFDPRNVQSATQVNMLEIGDTLQIDGHKLWQEYTGYKSFVQSLPMPWSVEVAAHVMHSPANRETMAVAYPLISNILGRIAVLPASSAQVERLFSTMKRIKSAQRNRLKSKTLDHLMRISIEGPSVQNWDPYPALRKWESMGNRRIQISRSHDSHHSHTSDSEC